MFFLGNFKRGGQIGVTFFFVLSGFLITYLLLNEDNTIGFISVKQFYLRRLIRIWPLYYLLVILGFFIFPCFSFIYENHYEILRYNFVHKLILFLSFMPNISLAELNIVPFTEHLWSIGVEEQFYLIWPLLIKFAKNKMRIMINILIIIIILKFIPYIINNMLELEILFLDFFREFMRLTRIECMAIGGIGAHILFHKKTHFLIYIYNKKTQIFTYITLLTFIILDLTFPFIHNYVYSILFIVLILNISSNEKSIINLEYKLLNYLGKNSYGLYMYHPICIAISYFILNSTLNISDNI